MKQSGGKLWKDVSSGGTGSLGKEREEMRSVRKVSSPAHSWGSSPEYVAGSFIKHICYA